MRPKVAWMRIFLCLLTLAAISLPSARASAQPSQPLTEHLVVISVDGMMPAAYLRPDRYNLNIPNLRRLMAEGSYAAGVIGVYPSVTYPSHATIVTGVPPVVHGIYLNELFTDPAKNEQKYQWEAKYFRVPTLWDAAHKAGLKTAAVGWPSTLGAPIDYHLPEIWDPKNAESGHDFRYAAPFATPGLVDALEHEFGPSTSKPLDEARTDAAVYILRQYRPNLLLLHIYDLDYAQHNFGPMSPQALKALEFADKQLGRLVEAAREAGILAETTFVIVSDHGFLPVRRDLNLGRVLVGKNLIKRGHDGKVSKWHAWPVLGGGAGYLFLHEPTRKNNVKKVYEALENYVRMGAIAAVFSPAATQELTGVEGAMLLEAGRGYRLREGWSRPVDEEASERRGAHGYLPFWPDMQASFIASGAGVRPGVHLSEIPMTAIAPTLATLLGVSLPPADPDLILSPILKR